MADKKHKGSVPSAHQAPFTGPEAVEPHYKDTIDPGLVKPSPEPTPPGKEPMAPGSLKQPKNTNDKLKQLDAYRADGEGMGLTTNMGVKISNNQNTLSAGERGPSLLEDFHFLEKMAHFDRERIPERVVHARGSGAHGYFQVYESLADYTKAAFLQDPKAKTPVFVRFSTVQGFRGSPDTVRDIRGWATKFYTSEGNFDLVGNDTAVFFIQDAIKFPDFVHAVKPEPHNEVPQGQSAHDSFWDYVSLQPEALHNVMWAMSDRGIPRSYRMMEGFGIHTYKMLNAQNDCYFVRFHWKPVYGKASLVWDESQALTGRDPDFHRKDLWQAIEGGDYPEYELGLQIIPEADEKKFDFDILDPTKLIPEALVPVKIVGKMVLDRNPDNFFTETEQVAFCPANIVPGIDFSDDPLLQGRVFSYKDTQMHRLGGPNFAELPINRPLCPMRSQQRDGMYRMQIDTTAANYEPNTISGNWPRETPEDSQGGGFHSHQSKIEGMKVRLRSASFREYFAHPRLFWLSQTEPEKRHIIAAFSFELGNVARPYIRERIVDLLSYVDSNLAKGVADNLGITLSKEQLSRKMPKPVNGISDDPALSLYRVNPGKLKSRKVSLLVADGVSGKCLEHCKKALAAEGIHPLILAPHMGTVKTDDGKEVEVNGALNANPSLFVDAVMVPEGASVQTLMTNGDALYHLRQAYKHLKAIALHGEAEKLRKAAGLPMDGKDAGLISGSDTNGVMKQLLEAMKQHRCWEREDKIKEVGA